MNAHEYTRREFVEIAFKIVGVGSVGGMSALYGCAQSGSANITDGPTATVVDSLGRSVTLKENPQHIACIDSYAGEYLVTIGAGPRLATIQNGTQSAELLRIVSPEIRDLPNAMLGGSINAETVLASGAEIAIVAPGTYQNKPEADKLKKLGVPVAAIGFSDIDTQIEAMRMLGQVCGGEPEKKSNELVTYFQDIVDYIEKHVAEIPTEKRIKVYHANSTPLATDGDMSVGTDWIARCGGVPVSRDAQNAPGQRSFETSIEQIYLWDPDIIICNETPISDAFTRAASWRGLRAAKENKVYHIPIGATRWGQHGSAETYLGMLWFAATFYPQYFPDLDLKREVVSYYSHFLGLDITDALYEQILSSQGLRKAAALDDGPTKELFA